MLWYFFTFSFSVFVIEAAYNYLIEQERIDALVKLSTCVVFDFFSIGDGDAMTWMSVCFLCWLEKNGLRKDYWTLISGKNKNEFWNEKKKHAKYEMNATAAK